MWPPFFTGTKKPPEEQSRGLASNRLFKRTQNNCTPSQAWPSTACLMCPTSLRHQRLQAKANKYGRVEGTESGWRPSHHCLGSNPGLEMEGMSLHPTLLRARSLQSNEETASGGSVYWRQPEQVSKHSTQDFTKRNQVVPSQSLFPMHTQTGRGPSGCHALLSQWHSVYWHRSPAGISQAEQRKSYAFDPTENYISERMIFTSMWSY